LASLTTVLASHTLIGLDTSPFIYLFEHHPDYFPLVEEIFLYLKSPDVEGITSIITLIETCVQPRRDGQAELVEIYEQALLKSQQVRMYDIDLALARNAIQLRVQYGFRVPDALQLSAALEHGATLFITNDRRLAKITELQILILADYLPATGNAK
jgi:predicted nucleic acid-binding protein